MIEQSLLGYLGRRPFHDWLDKCPSSSVEIIADEDGYWDVRVKVDEDEDS